MFKPDDDTYVRPGRLLASGFERHPYSGFVYDRRNRVYPFVPSHVHAHGGPGYWLDRAAMEIVAVNTSSSRQLPEDFITGKLLHERGIEPVPDQRYCHENRPIFRERVLEADTWITMHKCDPVEMRRIHLHLNRSAQPGNTASQTI